MVRGSRASDAARAGCDESGTGVITRAPDASLPPASPWTALRCSTPPPVPLVRASHVAEMKSMLGPSGRPEHRLQRRTSPPSRGVAAGEARPGAPSHCSPSFSCACPSDRSHNRRLCSQSRRLTSALVEFFFPLLLLPWIASVLIGRLLLSSRPLHPSHRRSWQAPA
jgi:hypothetical protein